MASTRTTTFLLLGASLALLAAAKAAVAVGKESSHIHIKEYNGTYHNRFENLDLDLILASRRLVHNYVACLMDVKPCTAEGDELKRILPDALRTRCSKCSARQKEGAKKVITTLQVRYPEQWRTLRKKWDLEKLKDVL